MNSISSSFHGLELLFSVRDHHFLVTTWLSVQVAVWLLRTPDSLQLLCGSEPWTSKGARLRLPIQEPNKVNCFSVRHFASALNTWNRLSGTAMLLNKMCKKENTIIAKVKTYHQGLLKKKIKMFYILRMFRCHIWCLVKNDSLQDTTGLALNFTFCSIIFQLFEINESRLFHYQRNI